MRVRRDLGYGKCVGLLTAPFTQRVAAAHMDRRPSANIRESEVDASITTNVVPSREKRAWFWLMGRSCPLQRAQPLGANTKLMILISDKKGSAILTPRRLIENCCHRLSGRRPFVSLS